MFKVLCCVIVAMSVGPSAAPPEPVRPIKPIELTTEIGNVGGDRAGIRVTLRATIDAAGPTVWISLYNHSFLGRSAALAIADAAEVAKLIESAASDAEANRVSVGKHGTTTIETYRTDTTMSIKLRMPESLAIPANRQAEWQVSIEIDADNAPTLARLLRRAEANAAWLAPRLKDLELAKP